MRVCPKCGFIEPIEWRGSAVRGEVEFCRLEDFKRAYPKLLDQLIKSRNIDGTKNRVVTEHYCYHITKGKTIERQSLLQNPTCVRGWYLIPVEASNKPNCAFGLNPRHHSSKIRKSSKNQRRLLEELEK